MTGRAACRSSTASDGGATWRPCPGRSASRSEVLLFPPHTDIGSLTILQQDDGPGSLQVLDRLGRWCDLEAVPGSFVVQIGGSALSAPHRYRQPDHPPTG